MENQGKNPINAKHTTVQAKNQTTISPLRPEKRESDAQSAENSEGMLHLLMSTESSAQRIQTSIRKWQLLSLVLTMLILPAVVVIVWLSAESTAARTRGGKLEMENQSLKTQLNTANAQIDWAKNEAEILMNRNIELVQQNSKLISKNNQPIAATSTVPTKTEQKTEQKIQREEPKIINAATPALDEGRMEKIRMGKYPSGTTRAELIAVLGEPNRIYWNRSYEQLVYFGRKPGRFWFIGNWLVQTTD